MIFSKNKEIRELLAISGELCDIGSTIGLLSWDQETFMPTLGATTRSLQLSTMSSIYHKTLTSRRVARLIEKCRSSERLLSEGDRALVREILREHERAVKVPTKLIKLLTQETSRAFEAWYKAKKSNSFALFAPHLESILNLKVQIANLLMGSEQKPYDVFLDDYEQGLSERLVTQIFEGVESQLRERLGKFSKFGVEDVDKSRYRNFDVNKIECFCLNLAKDMGFNFEAGREDLSAHPFTTAFGINDVRITTWKQATDLRSLILATIHETGHALYEQGVNPELERTHLAGGQGLILHESQSRIWENMVGRNRDFWKFYYKNLVSVQNNLSAISMDNFTESLNLVKPSFLRVDADEISYGLHIILRYNIERELVSGKIKIADLPEIWKGQSLRLLGVAPSSDSEGVLQDVHWSHGSFGYFPTYLLGTIVSAQLWRQMKLQISIEDKLQMGDLSVMRTWLKDNIHFSGKIYLANEIIETVTKEPINGKYLIEYLDSKYTSMYNYPNK